MSKRKKKRAKSASEITKKEQVRIGALAVDNGNGPAKAYRHKGEKRRNIPPAAIAAEGRVPAAPRLQYSYSPRLDPVLRVDPTGAPDKLPELLEKAKREPLTDGEARILAEAVALDRRDERDRAQGEIDMFNNSKTQAPTGCISDAA
jgi:hypothetical protein